MKKKIIWAFVIAVSVVILGGAYAIFASFNGSLIARAITTKKAKDYVAEKFPGEPYEVSFALYDFKWGGYFAQVQSTESEDTHFIVTDRGDEMWDDFERSVDGRQNTVYRLYRELDERLEAVLKEKFPHNVSLSYVDSLPDTEEADYKKLELDMELNPSTFPIKSGLVVWTETTGNEPTWDELAERYRELYGVVKEEFPFITKISLSIQYPYEIGKDGELQDSRPGSFVCAFDVPVEIIETDELEAHLEKVREEQEAEEAAIQAGEYMK